MKINSKLKPVKLLKKAVAMAVIFAMVIGLAPAAGFASSDEGIRVVVDGYNVTFDDQSPVFVDEYILVPVRQVFYQMGFTVSWDNDTRTATLVRSEMTVVIPADVAHIYVDGEAFATDTPQRLQNGRLLLSAAAVEAVGAYTQWDADANVLTITTTAADEDVTDEDTTNEDTIDEDTTDEDAADEDTTNEDATNEDTTDVTPDMLRFQYEYEALNDYPTAAGVNLKAITIPEFNLIQYITPEEILEIAESGTGLIYFGFPQCPWCRQMTPLLIDVALEMGLDVIHYLDLLPIRTTWQLQDGIPVMVDPGHPRYQDLLVAFSSVLEPMELNPFHLTDADGNRINTDELRIFVPTVVAIRDGVIVASHVYTVPASVPGNPYGNQWHPLSEEESLYLRAIYEAIVAALLD